ncbi:glycosyltransferase family 8 protein [Holdemania filiformis]|uniref:glycosyltransferase family 8 protein n=1 Tax=Holdemania filiformis TaxID=61171 RepID=UPI0024330F70|nr:glycosyltransferase family 8 protein [Holdemania filiformis]
MNVLYTCDDNYIWLMGISVISLFENNRQMSELNVYLLGENISDKNKQKLEEIGQKYNRKTFVINVLQLDIPSTLISARWPLSAFTRLYAGQLLPNNIKSVLYLDCDTIVKGDVSELEVLDISQNVFLGVKDCIGGQYKRNIGLEAEDNYVNAGVLIINLEELRKIDIKKILEKYMLSYAGLINYADQDVLNGVFHNQIGILDPKFDVMTIDVVHTYKEILALRKPTNFYSQVELENAVINPSIIHYTTNMRVIRPWYCNSNHPLKSEFVFYLNISPWKDKELSKMLFTSRESKIIGIIDVLPSKISYALLGLIHATVKPLFIRMKNERKSCR